MSMKMNEMINILMEKEEILQRVQCCVGFDGFIDEVFRVVRTRRSSTEYTPFETIYEFSRHIGAAAGKSADMEIISQEVKLGGNAPIMANSMGSMGVQTTCIGALGFPEIHEAYRNLSPNCRTISIAQPSYTFAYEFNDGKLMFGNAGSLEDIHWNNMKRRAGLSALAKVLDESALIGIVNWRYLNNLGEILEGMVEECFPRMKAQSLSEKTFFFDIADPSGRSESDMLGFLALLRRLSGQVKVILGLNEREARIVYEHLSGQTLPSSMDQDSLEEIGKYIFRSLQISCLAIHSVKFALGICNEGVSIVEGFFVEKPTITTGGGDNFNGGFCIGQLLNLSLEQSLLLGNTMSSFYVGKGYSPSYHELIGFIKLKNQNVEDKNE